MKQLLMAIICTLSLGLAACSGGGARLETQTSSATMGQELIDLKEAYDQDIISEKEYKRAKKDIMNMYDRD